MKKRLGRRWKKLHQTVYVIGVLVLIHYFMLVKADYWWPALYSLIFIGLMVFRVLYVRRRLNGLLGLKILLRQGIKP